MGYLLFSKEQKENKILVIEFDISGSKIWKFNGPFPCQEGQNLNGSSGLSTKFAMSFLHFTLLLKDLIVCSTKKSSGF